MPDAWGRERAQPVAVGPPRRRMSRADRLREARRRRRRRVVRADHRSACSSSSWSARSSSAPGCGTPCSAPAPTTRATGCRMWSFRSTTATPRRRSARRWKSTRWSRRSRAFVDAAEGNSAMSSIQPGFYKVRTEIPASDAVERLADAQNRVGKLVIPEGRQLDDIQDVKTNAVTDGIFTPDLQRDLCGPRRRATLRVERRPP